MKATVVSGRARTRPWTWWLFLALEVLAVVAVPVVALAGARVLLGSRAGTFVAGPGPDDPGYQALVEPSPVQPVIERRGGVVTGVTILTRPGADVDGGAAILVPGELQVDGQSLAEWGEAGDLAVVDALGRALRLRLADPVVVDEQRWPLVLGGTEVEVTNPDPVLVDGEAEPRFPAGPLPLSADDVADWLGQLGNQEPSALLFRRQLFWRALLDDAGTAVDAAAEPGATLASIAAGEHRVELLPVELGEGTVTVDADRAEELVVDVVPFPAGSQPGDRLRTRVLDRTGTADLAAVARQVARSGGEVVMIGNAGEFDGLPTEAVIADPALDEATRRLLERMGSGTVTLSPGSDDSIDVTVLAGPDLVDGASG